MRNYEVLFMESKELNRIVKVYIKLPKSYQESREDYPVLYLHDGQVGFNDFEEFDTTWGLFDEYIKTQKREVILVGINSGKTRIDELCPFQVTRKDNSVIGGKTDQYMDFIINSLMPEINKMYRTNSKRESTGLLGVSLGGLATIYAMTKYTETFSRFAFVSSAHYQFQSRLLELVKNADLSNIKKVYSDVGTDENEREDVKEKYVSTNKDMYKVLEEKLNKDTFEHKIIEGYKHEFEYWNTRIPHIIEFIFSD